MTGKDFYSTLQAWHEDYVPMLRFGQFMTGFFDWHKMYFGNDCFYLEDNKFLFRLDMYLVDVLKVKKEYDNHA